MDGDQEQDKRGQRCEDRVDTINPQFGHDWSGIVFSTTITIPTCFACRTRRHANS